MPEFDPVGYAERSGYEYRRTISIQEPLASEYGVRQGYFAIYTDGVNVRLIPECDRLLHIQKEHPDA